MIRDHLRHLAGLRKGALVFAAASMLALAVAAPAMAIPKGNFAPFVQCPLKNPEVGLCLFVQSTGGEFIIGNKTVPVNKTITLQGGSIFNPETETETFVACRQRRNAVENAAHGSRWPVRDQSTHMVAERTAGMVQQTDQ